MTAITKARFMDGLVCWLPMAEGAGTICNDNSLYRNNGTIINATWVAGRDGLPSLNFDGNGDYVALASTISSAARTQMGWFNFSQLASDKGVHNALFSNLHQHSLNNYIYLLGAGADYFYWVPTIDTDYHIAVVIPDKTDSIGSILYVNGTPYGVNQQGVAHSINDLTHISRVGVQSFKGIIDGARIYNRALDPYEIRAYYEAARKI